MRDHHSVASFCIWAALVAGVPFSLAAAAEPPVAAPPEGAPVAIPRARQYDLTSRINGRTYPSGRGLEQGRDRSGKKAGDASANME